MHRGDLFEIFLSYTSVWETCRIEIDVYERDFLWNISIKKSLRKLCRGDLFDIFNLIQVFG